MSQPVLWVIHTNKRESNQLLGQCIVPYEIYHLINCIHYLLYFHAYFVLKEDFSIFDVPSMATKWFLSGISS